MEKTLNNKIQRAFSYSAKQYDQFSSLHRGISDLLLGRLEKDIDPPVILDVGCGTGYLTCRLKEHYPQSKVLGLDFAEGMLEIARSKNKDVSWVAGDSNNLPLADRSVDIVVSNLAYQWVGVLVHSFMEARRVLVDNGVFTCTIFGYKTCQELFESLQEAKREDLRFSRLPDDSQVREALDLSGFKSFEVDSERIMVEYKDMFELIGWLKSIGANNLSHEGYLGRETLSKAALIFRERFLYHQGIGVTFEVIKVYARK